MAKLVERRKVETNIYLLSWQSGQKSYQVRVKDSIGRWFPSQNFERLVDARRYRASLVGDRGNGKLSAPRYQITKLFSEYWGEWLVECRGKVSDGWKIDQDRMGRDYILPVLGPMKLVGISPRTIGAVVESVQSLGRAPQTVRHVYNLLHKVFDDAIEHFQYLERSPVLRRYCPQVPRRERNFLKPAEAIVLMTAAKGHDLETAIMLGLFAGLRPSEIQALEWSAVDFDKNLISIRSAYKRKVRRIEPFPKQRNWGSAVMPHPLSEYLKAKRGGQRPSSFVAIGKSGEMLDYQVFLIKLKRLCKEAGVTVVTPHELRHSSTELWVFNRATQADCGRQLNHSSSSVTETYMHRTDDRLQEIAANFLLPVATAQSKPGLRLVR